MFLLILTVISAYSISVSYTHLDVYKRQTSWGGALPSTGQNWAWQIGASHCHEFYQNPLAAYALLADDGLKAGMKTGSDAVTDYEESLKRQLEFYLLSLIHI